MKYLLHAVKEAGNILHTTKKRRLITGLVTYCVELPSKHVTEGKIEERIYVTGRGG